MRRLRWHISLNCNGNTLFHIFRSHDPFISRKWLPTEESYCIAYLIKSGSNHSEVLDPHFFCEIYHLPEIPLMWLLPRISALPFQHSSHNTTPVPAISSLTASAVAAIEINLIIIQNVQHHASRNDLFYRHFWKYHLILCTNVSWKMADRLDLDTDTAATG